MMRLIPVALVGMIVLAVDARSDDALIQDVEQAVAALNKAFVKQDAAAIRGLLTTDHLAVTAYYGDPQTVGEELKSLPDLKPTEYTAGEMKVTPLGPDA